jgi:hypothetical protein
VITDEEIVKCIEKILADNREFVAKNPGKGLTNLQIINLGGLATEIRDRMRKGASR